MIKDYSKMSDEELDAELSSATAVDYSKLSDEELDAELTKQTGPDPVISGTAYKDILSIPRPVEGDVDDETHSRTVFGLFYEKKLGQKLSPEELPAQLSIDFGDGATYAQAHKELLKVHSTEEGEFKQPVTMSEEAQREATMTAKYGAQGIMGKMAQNVYSAVSGLMRVDAGAVAEKILPVTGPVGNAVSTALNASGVDVSKAVDAPFEQALEFKRAVADDIAARGGAAKDFWEIGIPDEVKQSFGYQAITGLGEVPMLALYAIPPVGMAVTASRYLDEGYSEAKASGKSEEESQNIALGYASVFAPLGVLVDKFTLGIGKGAKPAAGSVGKAILQQSGKVAVESLEAGLGELVTETAESAGLQKMTKGEVDWKQAFTEGMLAFISGVAGGAITGTANVGDYARAVDKLNKLGVQEPEAVVDRIVASPTLEEQLAVAEEVAMGTLEKAGKVEQAVDATVNPYSVDEDIAEVEQKISDLGTDEEVVYHKGMGDNIEDRPTFFGTEDFANRVATSEGEMKKFSIGKGVKLADALDDNIWNQIHEDDGRGGYEDASERMNWISYHPEAVKALEDMGYAGVRGSVQYGEAQNGTETLIFKPKSSGIQTKTDSPELDSLNARLEQLQQIKERQSIPDTPIVFISEPQTAGQLKSFVNNVVGGEEGLRQAVGDEKADQILAAAGGDQDALTALNEEIAGTPKEVAPEEVQQQAQTAEQEEEIVTTPKVVEGVQEITGISRKWNNRFADEMKQQRIPLPDRVKQTQTLQNAKDKGLEREADAMAVQILAGAKTQISSDEVAGLLLRKAEIQDEIDAKRQVLEEASKNNDETAFFKAAEDLDLAINSGVRLTEAAAKATTENARAVAAMAMALDRTSFDLVSVISEARRVKKAELTSAEKSAFLKLTTEWEQLATSMQADIDRLQEEAAKKDATKVIEQELSTVRSGVKKADAQKRKDLAKENLRKLGFRVNDIGGFTADAAKQVAEIAIAHIQEGAATLEEVVTRVQTDIPEISAKNIYDALGGRLPKDAKKVKTEIEKTVSELKTQARLRAEIEEALEGMARPGRKSPPSSKEVSDLRNKLAAIKASVIQTERDQARADAVVERIHKIEDMVERNFRPDKTIRLKSDALKEAEKRLATANAELRLQDRLNVLKEILSVGKTSAPKKEQPPSTQRMEELRAQVEIIEEQIKLGDKIEAHKATLDRLTNEVEKEYRTIVEERKAAPKTGLEESIAEMQQAKADQDTKFALLEALRTGNVIPVKNTPSVKNDSYGFKAAIQSLRQEIRATEQYKEWKAEQNALAREVSQNKRIAEMEAALKSGDLTPFMTAGQQKVVRSEAEMKRLLRKYELEKEINRRLRALKPKTRMDRIWDVYDAFRGAVLTADVGHIWRQAGFFNSNLRKYTPGRFTKQSFDALFSENKANALDLWVDSHPLYDDARIAGVHFPSEGGEMGTREMVIADNLIEKVWGIGAIAKASGRTQMTSMRVHRMQVYAGFIQRNPEATAEQRKDFAWAINILSGYGQGEIVGAAARHGGKVFTSARFAGSRYQAPTLLFRPRVWNNKALLAEIAEDTAWFIGMRIAALAALNWVLPDDLVSIGTNPDNHTFGKLIVKVDRKYSRVYDPWAGLAQMGRMMSAIATMSGKPQDIVLDDLKKRGHPALSAIYNVAAGKKYPNEDVPRWEALLRSVAPISVTGVAESMVIGDGPIDTSIAVALDIIGVGSYLIETKAIRGETEWKNKKESPIFKGKKKSTI